MLEKAMQSYKINDPQYSLSYKNDKNQDHNYHNHAIIVLKMLMSH